MFQLSKARKIMFSFVGILLAMPLLNLFADEIPIFLPFVARAENNTFTSCADVTEISKAECEALVALHQNTGGNGWTDDSGWLETNDPCDWRGVGCYSSPQWGRVVAGIGLDNNNLTGSLPSQLGNLSYASTLSFRNNSLVGNLPSELESMSQLEQLYVTGNPGLSGTIPLAIFRNEALAVFHWDGTQLCVPSDPTYAILMSMMSPKGERRVCD